MPDADIATHPSVMGVGKKQVFEFHVGYARHILRLPSQSSVGRVGDKAVPELDAISFCDSQNGWAKSIRGVSVGCRF